MTVNTPEGDVPVDTGFIVYNQRNYPMLTQLFAHLNVATQATDMSFGFSSRADDVEYAGDRLGTLRRDSDGVSVIGDNGLLGRFGQVVVAAHADQALAMLAQPKEWESRILDQLDASSSQRILEIGCNWGGFARKPLGAACASPAGRYPKSNSVMRASESTTRTWSIWWNCVCWTTGTSTSASITSSPSRCSRPWASNTGRPISTP